MALILPKSKDVTLALRMLFLKTEKKLVAELKRQQAKDLVDYGTYASLMRVQKILQNMEDESFVYVPEMVNKVFRDTNSRYAYEAAEALTVPQTAIAEQLTYNLLGNIQEAAETALKTSETILEIGRLHPDVFRNPAIAASLESEALGGSWSTAVKSALRTYQNGGITSFVDKSGRNWSLTDYCTMATRTVTNQASVAAVLTADDWDLWQISKIGTTCALCSAYEGRVYSKSGTNPDYPPLAMAFGKVDPAGGNDLSNTYLNLHPQCLHSLMRYTTAGKTDKQIERDKEFSSFEKRPADVDYRSKKQLAAYREKERTRAEFLQTRRQWNDYRDRLGKEIPSLETFEKHKKAGDDKYKAWEKAYRKKGAELRKENPELFVKKPKPASPSVVEPKAPVKQINIPVGGEATAKPPTKQIATFSEVKDALRDDLGFTAVSGDVLQNNQRLMVETTNQLFTLEDKFGVIHDSECDIISLNHGGASGYVQPSSYYNLKRQTLSLCPSYYKNRKRTIDAFTFGSRKRPNGEPGQVMPIAMGRSAIYPVTHEYGHMVQNRWMFEELKKRGFPTSEAYRHLSLADKRDFDLRIENEYLALAEQCRNEIIEIAKSRNPYFATRMNISSYGKKDSFEFFAECFANSQLGAPNELGEAMAIWLERNGQLR